MAKVEPNEDLRRLGIGLPIALGVLAWIGYGGVLAAPFAYDDYANIVDNPWIRSLGLESLWRAGFDSPTSRPIAYWSFAIDHALHGLDPWGFRLTNVAILLGCGGLVFDIARRLLARWAPDGSPIEQAAVAALAAVWFVAHPLQTQATTYVVQRMTGLAVLGGLAAIAAWLRAREAPAAAGRRRWAVACLAAGLFALGSKEIAITLPVAIWGIEWCAYRDLDRRFALRSVIGLGLPALLLGAAGYAWLMHDQGWGYAGRPFTAVERFLTSLRVVVHYGSLALFPAPGRLNLLHDFPLSTGWGSPPTTLASAAVLAGVLGGIGWAIRAKRPALVFCGGWVVLQLLLESFVLPLRLSFEHRMMAPLVGLVLLAALGWMALWRHHWRPAVAAGLALALVLAGATRARNEVWTAELSLWSDVVAKSPRVVAAQNNLGTAALRAGQPGRARAAFEAALALAPNDAEALDNLGGLDLEAGRLDTARAYLDRALAADPGLARAHYNRGRLAALSGDLDRALERLQTAVALAPERSVLWNGLGAVHAGRNAWREAAEAFARAVALDPANGEARSNLALARERLSGAGSPGSGGG